MSQRRSLRRCGRRLPLEEFISDRTGLDAIEDASHKMHAGAILRLVVVM